MSEFIKQLHDYGTAVASEIDFDDAVKLAGGGSTCEIFRTRWQRRDVLVKRLKEPFRMSPLHLDAFDKEFEIGVSLRHPSLPEYREFHRDYIVMDYIDGATLAEMIRWRDPWLEDEAHVGQLLRELVDVVDYLHRHNVVHCDIKPDNIMVTSNAKHLVLIDFDKCYTDALNYTSGHPGKYGLTEDAAGRTLLDFRGIGHLAERLCEVHRFTRSRRFVKACASEAVSCEKLRRILDRASVWHGVSKGVAWVAFMGVAAGVGGYIFYLTESSELTHVPAEAESIVPERVDTAPQSTLMPPRETSVAKSINESKPSDIEVLSTIAPSSADSTLTALDDAVRPYFNDMIAGLNRLDQAHLDLSLTADQLMTYWIDYQRLEREKLEAMIPIVEAFTESHPGQTSSAVNSTRSCIAYLSRSQTVKKRFLAEMDRRSN